jgi:hypothetical protein
MINWKKIAIEEGRSCPESNSKAIECLWISPNIQTTLFTEPQ